MNASKDRSPRLRFRLRTLFLLMLVPIAVIQIVNWRHEMLRAKKRDELSRMGGRAAFLVEDGDLVLLRKGEVFGALMVRTQTLEPEEMEFEWYYREDGNGMLATGDPAVLHGKGSTGTPTTEVNIRFGPFDLQWSGGDDGFGWFYYPRADAADAPTEVCYAGRNRWDRIDAADPRWIFETFNDHSSSPHQVISEMPLDDDVKAALLEDLLPSEKSDIAATSDAEANQTSVSVSSD